MENTITPEAKPVTEAVAQYPVSLSVTYPEKNSRMLALAGLLLFVKAILLIPHFLVLYILALITLPVVIIHFLIVLFTGKQNRSLFDFLVGYSRWTARANAYMFGLTDVYPPFRLED